MYDSGPSVFSWRSQVFSVGTAKAADQPAKVFVVLWFDTEDYLLPASDDAALRLATFLKTENIRGTFKVVGEKARTLERRGRQDVIAALARHEIGYHSNYHSTQPSPAMYLNDMGWREGVREFTRREKAGFDDVRRIFGQTPTCYGQPGSSWAPQSFGALEDWGVQIYLDGGGHVGLDDKPCYYCNTFTMYKLAHLQRTLLGGPADVVQAENKFLASRTALQKEGGGLVSIIYHPCEFVHKEFWDGVNFRQGANPPREQWKLPRQKTAEETATAFACFERYRPIHEADSPDSCFVTASRPICLYRDRARDREFSLDEIKTLAQGVGPSVSFRKLGDLNLSAAEVFWLLNTTVARPAEAKNKAGVTLARAPFGPSRNPAEAKEPVQTSSSQFLRTAVEVDDLLRSNRAIPDVIWLGSLAVSPETYLQGLASVTLAILEDKPLPETVTMEPGRLEAAKYVADDDIKLWKWVIFPPGFHAPALMQLAKRQAWTLKPAVLHVPE